MSDLVDDLNAEVADATFETWGRAAQYTPPDGGTVLPCQIRFDVREEGDAPSDGRPKAGQKIVLVRASEVPTPVGNGTFTVLASAKVLTVVGRVLPADRSGTVLKMWVR